MYVTRTQYVIIIPPFIMYIFNVNFCVDMIDMHKLCFTVGLRKQFNLSLSPMWIVWPWRQTYYMKFKWIRMKVYYKFTKYERNQLCQLHHAGHYFKSLQPDLLVFSWVIRNQWIFLWKDLWMLTTYFRQACNRFDDNVITIYDFAWYGIVRRILFALTITL